MIPVLLSLEAERSVFVCKSVSTIKCLCKHMRQKVHISLPERDLSSVSWHLIVGVNIGGHQIRRIRARPLR